MSETKNRTMRFGVAALIIAIITLIALSATFAKYVSEGSATDSARVAKGGVTIENKNPDLFKTSYTDVDDTYLLAESSNNNKIVAPGTENGAKLNEIFNITGKPEVRTKLSVMPTIDLPDNGANWMITSSTGVKYFYCPIIFYFCNTNGEGESFANGAYYTDYGQGKNALDQWLSTLTYNEVIYNPNKDLSTAAFNNVGLGWRGPFERYYSDTSAFNEQDTALGNKAATAVDSGDSSSAPGVNFGFKLTIEQTQDPSDASS